MFPRAQINTKDDLDDDEQKKDEHKSSGSNPSQSSKATGGKMDEKKKGKEDKKERDAGKKRKRDVEGERRNRKDSSTRMRMVVLAERLRERNIRHARKKDEWEERERKYAKEIEMFEQRSNELKAIGLSRKNVLRQISTSYISRDIEKYVEKSKMTYPEVPRDIVNYMLRSHILTRTSTPGPSNGLVTPTPTSCDIDDMVDAAVALLKKEQAN
ncbi:hypothetical protein AgCh_012820 [Apium graveolens]